MHDQRVRSENKCAELVADYEAQGQTLALKFLDKIPELRRMLATDVDLPTIGKSYVALLVGSVGSLNALSETLTM